jgi:hypothetical protein
MPEVHRLAGSICMAAPMVALMVARHIASHLKLRNKPSPHATK